MNILVQRFSRDLLTLTRSVYLLCVILSLVFVTNLGSAEIPIRDLVTIQGNRVNQITGYGLVVGLNGTGDTRSALTQETLHNYLNYLGVDAKHRPKDTRNVAAVLITAIVPNWVRVGDRVDVTVSSIGDARSLEGGVLLQSPLKFADGKVVALATGSIPEMKSGPEQGQRTYSKRNSGSNSILIPLGAVIEKEIPGKSIQIQDLFAGKKSGTEIKSDATGTDSTDPGAGEIEDSPKLRFLLHSPGFSTMNAIIEKLEENFDTEELSPVVLSDREFEISIPKDQKTTAFLAKMETLKVKTDLPSKIVINQKTGTVIIGGSIRMDEVAISKQGLKVKLESKGKSRYFWTEADEKSESVFHIKKITNVKSLVDELNRLGASTSDIISILQGLKKSGALNAEVIVQ
jgi:flagellar P-ring protein precursor FlgI